MNERIESIRRAIESHKSDEAIEALVSLRFGNRRDNSPEVHRAYKQARDVVRVYEGGA